MRLVTEVREKTAAQRRLKAQLTEVLPPQGVHTIGFPGGRTEKQIYSSGDQQLWVAFGQPSDEAEHPRFWNAFGIYDSSRASQNITVEINIPTRDNSGQVAGFFARDPETDDIFLMHSAKIGGGREGIGKNAFLVWSMSRLVEVIGENGKTRAGIIVGKLDSADLVDRIQAFVSRVHDFKKLAAVGELSSVDFRQRIAEYERYRKEFAGRKRGSRSSHFDYVSYHGEVVQALFEERRASCSSSEEVFNSVLIDLYVKANGVLTEVYEVKTSTDLQPLYTAIGQLMTHSTTDDKPARRTLVIPEDRDLPAVIAKAISSLDIQLRYFRLVGRRRKRVELVP